MTISTELVRPCTLAEYRVRRISRYADAGLRPEEQTEQAQKQRGLDARRRLDKRPPKPLQMTIPVTVEKPKRLYIPEFSPRENIGNSWINQAPIAPYDEMDLIHVRPVTKWRGIVHEVCDKHRVTFMEIISKRRMKHLCAARHEAVYRLAKETTASLPMIVRWMGNRDHTTAINSIKVHTKFLERMKANDADS